MRNVFFLIVVLAVIQNWDRITDAFDSAPPIRLSGDEQVVLYATQWCGYCAKARTFLESKGIPYLEYDIEKSHQGRKEYDALGGRGVPLMVINGTLVRGYNERGIMAALVRN